MQTKAKVGLAIAGAVALGAVAVPPVLDRILTRRYEKRIVAAVRARYGGTLRLDGFRIHVLSSTAEVDGFRYEDAAGESYRAIVSGGPTRVVIDGLQWSPEIIRFQSVTLDKPDVALVRTARGDWDKGVPGMARDLVAAGIERARQAFGIPEVTVERPEPGKPVTVEKKKRVIELGVLTIKGARITYEDGRFTQAPIKLTLRDFNFQGTDLTTADVWATLLTSDADGVLEIGSQRIDVRGRTQQVAGEDKKLWSLEAKGIDLVPIAGPILRPLILDVKGGSADVRLSHLFDLSVARRSAFVIDYHLTASGVALEVREAKGVRAVLLGPAQQAKAWVDERNGTVELSFSVEASPDLALLGKDAGSVVEAIGKLTFDALRKKLLESIGLGGLVGAF